MKRLPIEIQSHAAEQEPLDQLLKYPTTTTQEDKISCTFQRVEDSWTQHISNIK